MGGCLPSYPQPPESQQQQSQDSHMSALDSKKPGAHFKNWTYVETHHQNVHNSPQRDKVLEQTHSYIDNAHEDPKSGEGDRGDRGDRADYRN